MKSLLLCHIKLLPNKKNFSQFQKLNGITIVNRATTGSISSKKENKFLKSCLDKQEHFSLWKEAFWSKSFFLATRGGVTLETLKQYVENQGNNHR